MSYFYLTSFEGLIMRQRGSYRQLNELSRIFGMREDGFSFKEIANCINRNQYNFMHYYQ